MKSFTHHLSEAKEWVLWGLPRGKRDRIHEKILYTQARSEADVERVKALAAKDGWHSFRVQVLDLSKPFNASAAFGKAVREKQKSVEITEAAAVTIVKGKHPNTWITSHGKYMIAKCNEYHGYVSTGKKIYCIYDGDSSSYAEMGGYEANLIRRLRNGGQPDEVVDTLAKAKAMVMQWVKNTQGNGRKIHEGTEHGDTAKPKPEYFKQPFSIGGKIVQLYPVFDVPVKTKSYNRKIAGAMIRAWERTGRAVRANEMSPEQQRVVYANSVWRWRVRIQTDEGWMLMGFIGSTKRKEDLPPIRAGDTVELTGLQLSARTGGHRYVEGGYYFTRGGIDRTSETALDYRSNRYDRQLHGKVKRKAV